MITVADLLDDDEDGVAARHRFEELQDRAQSVGLTLTRTSQGFVLVTKTHSRHTPDLDSIATLLNSKGVRA